MKSVSPILPEGKNNYLIDIDGIICDDVPNEEPDRMITCKPGPDARLIINKWYDEGHIVAFFTSRTEALREITEDWLNKHDFKYHGILMGKPRGGNYLWVDNHIVKGIRFKSTWSELVFD